MLYAGNNDPCLFSHYPLALDVQETPIILKIGGSLLSKSDEVLFDFQYLERFHLALRELAGEGSTFVIAVGGGFIARKYQALVRQHGEKDTVDIHKIGVAVTNLNAEIVHGLLDGLVTPDVIRYKAYDDLINGIASLPDFGSHSVLVTSASKPGHSNDWNALRLAMAFGSEKVIVMKNVDGVYTADPKKSPDAKRLSQLTCEEYLEIIGNPAEHRPGANYPIDPFAAKEAKLEKKKFVIIGSDLENFKRVIKGQNFIGTVMES